MPTPDKKSTFRSILRGVCPRCRQGRVFKTWIEIHDLCPVCGLRLNRESGYFIGAMYIEYGFSAVVLTLFTLAVRPLHPFALLPAIILALLLYLPASPYTI